MTVTEQLDSEIWGMLMSRDVIGTDVLAIFATASIILRSANRGQATAPAVTAAALMVLAESFAVAHDTSDEKLNRFRRAIEEAQTQLPPRSIPDCVRATN